MKLIYTYIFAVMMLGLVSCRKSMVDPVDDISTVPISFDIEQAVTKASLFEEDSDLKDVSKGGGNFSVCAYKSGTGTKFLYNQRVWYFQDGKSWHFYDDAINNVTHIYWPNTFNLDFFAYMPYHNANLKTGVTLEGRTGSGGGPSFFCELPLDAPGQDELHEFIYAYTPDQNKDNLDPDGKVKLNFKHPFSSIIIRLSESYRMNINWIKIKEIYCKGIFDVKNGWSFTSEPKPLIINLDKNVPDDINYNSLIGGPYVILPQELTDKVELEINFTRDDKTDTKSVTLKNSTQPKWEPGMIYTYTLKIGDPAEEILFNVAVEEWNVIEYKNEVGIE